MTVLVIEPWQEEVTLPWIFRVRETGRRHKVCNNFVISASLFCCDIYVCISVMESYRSYRINVSTSVHRGSGIGGSF